MQRSSCHVSVPMSAGTRRKNPGTRVSPTTTDSAIQATETTPTVLIVPFSIRAAVASPAGANYYSCDDMFGTDQVLVLYCELAPSCIVSRRNQPGFHAVNPISSADLASSSKLRLRQQRLLGVHAALHSYCYLLLGDLNLAGHIKVHHETSSSLCSTDITSW